MMFPLMISKFYLHTSNQFDALIHEDLLISEMKPSLNANIHSFPLALLSYLF